jgi:phosphonate transport system substrate-binding protein
MSPLNSIIKDKAVSYLFCVLFGLSIFLSFPGSSYGRGEELLIGIEPEHNIFDQMRSYRKLADYLSEKLEVKIRLTIMSRYGEALQRFESRRLSGAFLNSYTTSMVIRELDLEPVVRKVKLNGEAVTYSYIVVRADSGIRKVADMRMKRFAFVDPATTEGYLFPLAFLKGNGIDDLTTFLEGYYFTGSHTSAVFAVLDGRADIGAVKETVYNKVVSGDATIGRELVVIKKSPPIPETTLCLSKEISSELRARITTTMLEMNGAEEGRKILKELEALRFTPAGKDDYRTVLQIEQQASQVITGR